ncbi:MAG: 50S ribosomal protein L11 methyltransferase [Bacteroidaceae bacterium]
MKYEKVMFGVSPCSETVCDVLVAVLAEVGFDSFVHTDKGVEAYLPLKKYSKEAVQQALAAFPMPNVEIDYLATEAEDKDWNAEWEKNYFQPIVIGNRCVVHSTFHTDVPKAEYDIAINPKMSFGTGHHATTNQIVAYLLDAELQGKSVLDMGCGTSILAILASMRGANPITAIDNDEWCVTNSKENLTLNAIQNIAVRLGDASSIEGCQFDVIIANINRNILLADLPAYAATMHKGSQIYMSGFYVEDIPIIRARAENLGLSFIENTAQNRWAAVHFEK